MKKKIFLSIIILIVSTIYLNAQCKEFIESISEDALTPYISDGNFFAPVMTEGEKIELSRIFFANQKYKITILGVDFLEKRITIKDDQGNILFRNYAFKKNEKSPVFKDIDGNQIPFFGSTYWEFTLDRTQNLTIIVQLEKKSRGKNLLKGCVGIVVGFAE